MCIYDAYIFMPAYLSIWIRSKLNFKYMLFVPLGK